MTKEDEDGRTVLMFCAVVAGIALLLVAFLVPWPQLFAGDDLQAQQNMAAAAWAMVGVTFASLLLGAVTLVYLRRTLNATLRAAKAAEDAAVATSSAGSAAAELARAQVRAYLSVNKVKLDVRIPACILNYSVANTGQSPAKYVSIDWHFIVSSRPHGSENDDYTYLVDWRPERIFLDPLPADDAFDEEIEFPFSAIVPNQALRDLSEHKVELLIVVVADCNFSDVFSERLSESVRFRCHFDRVEFGERRLFRAPERPERSG